jgi:hypothetical protein
MERSTVMLLGSLILAATSGCRSAQLANDQDRIRQAVLDLHTTQILDNLVRLDRGLPIIQLDYIHMTGTITQNEQGSFGGGQTTVSTSNQHFKGVVPPSIFAFTRAFTNTFAYSTQAGQTNQLTITAEPVTTNAEVYNAYLEFLKDKGNLICTPQPPGPCDAIVCRSYPNPCCTEHRFWHRDDDVVYYWVPTGSKDAFRRLSLYAVDLRVDGTTIATTAFSAKILGVENVEREPDQPNCLLDIVLDKQIPKDDGTLIATIKGKLYSDVSKVQIQVTPKDKTHIAQRDPVPADEKSDRFQIVLNVQEMGLVAPGAKEPELAKAVQDLIAGLGASQVSIKLKRFAPTQGRTDNLLEDIRSQLELQRLNQAL